MAKNPTTCYDVMDGISFASVDGRTLDGGGRESRRGEGVRFGIITYECTTRRDDVPKTFFCAPRISSSSSSPRTGVRTYYYADYNALAERK